MNAFYFVIVSLCWCSLVVLFTFAIGVVNDAPIQKALLITMGSLNTIMSAFIISKHVEYNTRRQSNINKVDDVDDEISKAWSNLKHMESDLDVELKIETLDNFIKTIEHITSKKSSVIPYNSELSTSISELGQSALNAKAKLLQHKNKEAQDNAIKEFDIQLYLKYENYQKRYVNFKKQM